MLVTLTDDFFGSDKVAFWTQRLMRRPPSQTLRSRRLRSRDYRKVWIMRLNAAVRTFFRFSGGCWEF